MSARLGSHTVKRGQRRKACLHGLARAPLSAVSAAKHMSTRLGSRTVKRGQRRKACLHGLARTPLSAVSAAKHVCTAWLAHR